MNEVVITGVGPILPNCSDRAAFWRHIGLGESQVTLEKDPACPKETVAMGRIRDFDARAHMTDVPERFYSRFDRAHRIYLASLFRAFGDAGLAAAALKSDRVGLFDGTSRDHLAWWLELTTRQEPLTRRDIALSNSGIGVGLAASILGVTGPTYTFSNTCASGAVAIGHALRELQCGDLDVALGTGHDSALLSPFYQLYGSAGLVGREREDPRRALRPFGGHSKNVFGEGAMTLVLETRRHAEARGAQILATLAGYRYGNSGTHPSNIDEKATRASELMEDVLESAGVRPDEVDFVLGHGNGVEPSDSSEFSYMRRVFGDRVREVPLISIKPIYGHVLGASAAINAAAATLMLHNQFVVPTINMDPRRATGLAHQANKGEPRACRAGLVVCYGMGGQNAVLLLRRAA